MRRNLQIISPPTVPFINTSYFRILHFLPLQAFGYEGHGIIAVTNVPKAAEYREKALPLAYKFANLPEEIKDKYVNEESLYNIGWSHGKEKLEGKPDYAKGSFYANPTYDVPVSAVQNS